MSLNKIAPGQYTITAPGIYELAVDETNTNGTPFLNIAAHYVTVRLRGRFEASAKVAPAILCNGYAQVSVLGEGVNIRGFKYGTQFINAFRTTIRELNIFECANAGIYHTGNEFVCERNIIKNIGANGSERVFGVRSLGQAPIIMGNVVRDLTNTQEEVVGISSDGDGDRGIIAYNMLVNSAGPGGNLPSGLPNKWGMWIGASPSLTPNVDVVHNHLNGWDVCFGFTSSTEGLIDENSARNFTEYARVSSAWQQGGVDG